MMGETLIKIIVEAHHYVRFAAPFINDSGMLVIADAIAAATKRDVTVEIINSPRSTSWPSAVMEAKAIRGNTWRSSTTQALDAASRRSVGAPQIDGGRRTHRLRRECESHWPRIDRGRSGARVRACLGEDVEIFEGVRNRTARRSRYGSPSQAARRLCSDWPYVTEAIAWLRHNHLRGIRRRVG